MAKFLDALLGRQQLQGSSVMPVPPAQPVPVANAYEPPSALSSGSSINQAAVGAWPRLIDAGAKFWNGGWRKSVLKQVSTQNIPANFGSETSQSLFGFRYRAFAGIGNAPGPIPTPYRNTYNDLTPIVWGLRVANPNIIPQSTAQTGPKVVQAKSTSWPGSSTASVTKTGEVLL